MLIFSMAMCFMINRSLSFVFLAALCFLAVILALIMGKASSVFREVFDRYDDLNASIQENVAAIRVVKAYVREDHENKKFSRAAQNLYRLFVKAESMLALNQSCYDARGLCLPDRSLMVSGRISSWQGA